MQTRWIVQVNLRMNRTFPDVSDGTLFNRLEVYFFPDISDGTLFNRLEVYFVLDISDTVQQTRGLPANPCVISLCIFFFILFRVSIMLLAIKTQSFKHSQ